MLNSWEFLTLPIKDSNNISRVLSSDISGNLQWNGAPVFVASAVTVGTGLFALASNPPTGALSLSLTGTESRTALKLQDSSSVARSLSSNTSGDVFWDGQTLATQTWANTQLLTKQADLGISFATGSSSIVAPTTNPPWTVSNSPWSVGASYATVSLGAVTTWEFYYMLSVTQGQVIDVSLQVQQPPSGSCTNCLIYFYDSNVTNMVEATSGNGLNSSGFTTFTNTYTVPAAGVSTLYVMLGGIDSGVPSGGYTQSTGDLYIKDFSITSPSAGSTLYSWTGDVNITGTLSASSKAFDIVHPDASLQIPGEKEWWLRHFCVESSSPGGLLMYRRTVNMDSATDSFKMPSWFKHLAKDVIIQVTPFKHFGSAWGELLEDGVTINVHTTTKGQWHVLNSAARNDTCAVCQCPQEIEYKGANVVPQPVEPQPMEQKNNCNIIPQFCLLLQGFSYD